MSVNKSDYLFAYSSLLQGFSSPEYEYIKRYFDFVGPAKVRGKLSIKEPIVVGTPSEKEEFIQGELYRIKQQDLFSFAIGQLDEYEGVDPEPPQVALYKRSMATAILPDGQQIPAWSYWYNREVDGLPIIESGNILDFLKSRS